MAVAVQLLTRFRVPGVEVGEGDLRRASGAFPLIGVLVAALGIGVRMALEPLWGPVVATIAAVAAMVMATGALHEDGLADTVDGVWGGRDADERLAIMRDSRVGAYGVVALVTVLALQVALLAPLPVAGFASGVLVAHVLGRGAMVVLAWWLPAARDEGSGVQVTGRPPLLSVAVAGVTVAAVLIAAVGMWAPVPLAAGLLAVATCRRLFRRRLGGVTGDALGAANQLVYLAALAAVSALLQGGLL